MKRRYTVVIRWWLVFVACTAPFLLTTLLIPLALAPAWPFDWAWVVFLGPVVVAVALLTLALRGSSLPVIALGWLLYAVVFAYPLWLFWMQLAWLLI